MARQARIHVDDAKKFGQRLRQLRDEAGVSQRALSFPGCTSAYISRIEAGDRVPSLQVIHEFARRLRVSPVFLATGVDEDEEKGELLDAEVALRLGEFEDARRLYRKRLAADPGDPDALVGLGTIAFRENHVMKAISLLEPVIEGQKRLLELAGAVETLSRAYALSGALDTSIALLERALSEAEEAQAAVEILRFRILLANALIDNTQFARAEQMLADALTAAEDLHDPLAMARVYWSQSRFHTHHRNPRLGIRYARRAIEILERTENDAYVATAYHLLAYAQIEAGNADCGLKQLARGRELFADALTDRDDAKFSLEETRALLALGRRKPAAKKAAEALAKIEALDPLERGRAFMLLGDVFHANGDADRAVELYESAIKLLEESGRSYLIEAGRRLAEVLEELGRPADALAALKRAVASEAEPPKKNRANERTQRSRRKTSRIDP
jgi:tetratricopeptide (TPR) repeat protein